MHDLIINCQFPESIAIYIVEPSSQVALLHAISYILIGTIGSGSRLLMKVSTNTKDKVQRTINIYSCTCVVVYSATATYNNTYVYDVMQK